MAKKRFVLQCLSSFAIILLRKRELVALLCVLAVVWLLVLFVSSSLCCGDGLQCVIVGLSGHFFFLISGPCSGPTDEII